VYTKWSLSLLILVLLHHRDKSPSSSPCTSFGLCSESTRISIPYRDCGIPHCGRCSPLPISDPTPSRASAVIWASHRPQHPLRVTAPAFPFAKSVHSDLTRTAQTAPHFQLTYCKLQFAGTTRVICTASRDGRSGIHLFNIHQNIHLHRTPYILILSFSFLCGEFATLVES
jgi:hypothetical protein